MQGFNAQGYARPGSGTGFAGRQQQQQQQQQVYGGYQSAVPSSNSQWAPPPTTMNAQGPVNNAQVGQQQWGQQGGWAPQQAPVGPAPPPTAPAPGGYNPGTYGVMPGAFGAQTSSQQQYTTQQQDQPPPPPPKPPGWSQQTTYGTQQQQQQQGYQAPQQSTGFGQQGQQDFSQQGRQDGYQQQTGFQSPAPAQQAYNSAAPPPPSNTPGGSYFPPTQSRPGSIYGADQTVGYSSPTSATATHPPNSALSPNEQHPAYIPPSLSGQGVQSYMPTNTNPQPGVYVPPPPDIPAWQPAAHAPLQGGRFRYTKPNVDPSFQPQQPQGFQGQMGMQQPVQQQLVQQQPVQQQPVQQQPVQQQPVQQQPVQQQPQYEQQPVQPQQSQHQFGQQGQIQFQQQHHLHQPQQQPQGMMQAGQFVQPSQPISQQFVHPDPQQGQFQQQQQQQQQQPPQQITQQPQNQQMQQPTQQFSPQSAHWQPTPPADQGYTQQQPAIPAPYGTQQLVQQQGWQPGHQAQESAVGQQYQQGPDPGIQAPKPISGHTGSTPPGFVNDISPQSQPVSPVQQRQSVNFGSGQTLNNLSLGRTNSVSSIAMTALQNAGAKTSSPAPQKNPIPPPPRDDASKFSALGAGGPSDWEHFGAGVDEIDDEEFFGGKKDEKKMMMDEAVQLDGGEFRSELPSQSSPPSTTEDWPTPPSQPINVGIQRRDTYQPTPPPPAKTASPAQGSQPQSFVMDDGGWMPSNQATPIQQQQQLPPTQANAFVLGDAIISSQSPQPAKVTEPPAAQQNFVMDDGGWAPPKQSTPAQQQQQSPPAQANTFVMDDGGLAPPKQSTPAQQPQAPPLAQQSFVMDDGGWGSQAAATHDRNRTPVQQPHQPPPASNTFVMGDVGWGAAEQTPTQTSGGWGAQAQNQNHDAELKAKNEAYERLKADVEREKADLQAQLAKLKAESEKEKAELHAQVKKLQVEVESAKTHADAEKNTFNEQIESMKSTAEKAKDDADMLNKEKDATIERLREDIEGKDDVIEEKNTAITELKRQLDVEKTKEPPQPTPADLVPDIDPWYAGSLERYIAMLRSEANEAQVEDKIKAFTSFLKSESAIRGLEYYNAPPPAPVQEPVVPPPQSEPGLSRGPSNASARKHEVHIQVPQQDVDSEPVVYSPGGRPILQRKSTIPSQDSVTAEHSFIMSSEPVQNSSTQESFSRDSFPSDSSTQRPILTPTSSTDDDFNKTPIQPSPEEQPQPQPQYKAYVPPASSNPTPMEVHHRQSMSFVNMAPTLPLNTSKAKSDEIFFGEPQAGSKPASRPTTSTSSHSDVPIPAPLSFTPAPPVASTPNKTPLEKLEELLPKRISQPEPNARLQEIRKQAESLSTDFSFIDELTKTWEKTAAATRKKNDRERHQRQEESEARTDQLFNDNEISYAEIGDLEEGFKAKELELKAQEDRDEYKAFVEHVFDKVYDSLQGEIKRLMEGHIEVEALLPATVSGIYALSATDVNGAPSTKEAIVLLKDLHELVELRHDKVVQAVAERDKRYKKTEIQPLYAKGEVKKMKSVERHFENAERQAVVRAKGERAERTGELVRVVEESVVRAVGTEQREIEGILSAIKNLDDGGDDAQPEAVHRARETLVMLKSSSKELLALFNKLEMQLNAAVFEAEIANAKATSAEPAQIQKLEGDMRDSEKKLVDEYLRRIGVIEQDAKEIEDLVAAKGSSGCADSDIGAQTSNMNQEKGGKAKVLSEEDERERRLKAALEEAKRRNGEKV
ncbi:hypothetical protein CC78DRAFT_536807 [Lojkania enalia]|uniref:Uncharacterized protein n=1 Tax=Lojkania enalia TaxID=147567 RepID=A0A9P4K2U1_9PLEO|nr:hypothetical protein CC78DRAFT_536807 [Didymosphaeria enalia]